MFSDGYIVKIGSMIDFSLLDPRATKVDVEKLCDIAYKNQYHSVCVNPVNIVYAKGYINKVLNGALKVCCVVGFPLGANLTDIKILETKKAIEDGVDEIDVVINIGKAKEGDFSFVKSELLKIRKVAKRKVVKAIIETCYFDENDIIKLCKVCASAKVDYVQTSTGFGIGGADCKIVSLMKRELAGRCKIKAAAGVKTREQGIELVNCGADRIGTSRIL